MSFPTLIDSFLGYLALCKFSMPFKYKYSIYGVLLEGLRKKVSLIENVDMLGVMFSIVSIILCCPHTIFRLVASSLF